MEEVETQIEVRKRLAPYNPAAPQAEQMLDLIYRPWKKSQLESVIRTPEVFTSVMARVRSSWAYLSPSRRTITAQTISVRTITYIDQTVTSALTFNKLNAFISSFDILLGLTGMSAKIIGAEFTEAEKIEFAVSMTANRQPDPDNLDSTFSGKYDRLQRDEAEHQRLIDCDNRGFVLLDEYFKKMRGEPSDYRLEADPPECSVREFYLFGAEWFIDLYKATYPLSK